MGFTRMDDFGNIIPYEREVNTGEMTFEDTMMDLMTKLREQGVSEGEITEIIRQEKKQMQRDYINLMKEG